MYLSKWTCAVIMAWAIWTEAGAGEFKVTVDNLNIRAKPSMTSEVLGQFDYEELVSVKTMDEEWAEIQPPESIDLCVHRDFVTDGVVATKKLNVRAGPGINYTVVGSMQRGDQVEVRSQFGDWLKIAPPPSASLWVSREYLVPYTEGQETKAVAVTVEEPADNTSATQPTRSTTVIRHTVPRFAASPTPTADPNLRVLRQQSSTQTIRVSRPTALPSEWKLIPLEGQGRRIEWKGVLARVPFMLRRPTRFRLVQGDSQRDTTLCYVWGNTAQLEEFEERSLILRGRRYEIRGFRYPVLVVEEIVLP